MVHARGTPRQQRCGRSRGRECERLRFALVGALLTGSQLEASDVPADALREVYKYRSYKATMAYFEKLRREYPEIVETFSAQEAFPEVLPSRRQWGTCDGEPCQTLVVRLGNRSALTRTTPEVFFSGALHGDERIGPATVTELAGFLCRRFRAGDAEIVHLLNTRSAWITPMTNAEGYANFHREENGIDPNRDFPYLQKPGSCMRSQTARVVNELFRRHLFQFMLTFHGGIRSLTYEWGSRNHAIGRKSTEAPDNSAFVAVGRLIQRDAGRDARLRPWYQIAPITDLVYWVDGGMEDWSYGAGWEASPSPITVCTPKDYGGYAANRTKYRRDSIATIVYLAETDDFKSPPATSLGSTTDVWGLSGVPTHTKTHVARNLRMCLRLLELARPEVLFIDVFPWRSSITPGTHVKVDVRGFGCITISSAELLLVPRDKVDSCANLDPPGGGVWSASDRRSMLDASTQIAFLEDEVACHGLSVLSDTEKKLSASLSGRVPDHIASGRYCLTVAAEFDLSWGHQSRPDPNVSPRSIAARTRLENHFTAAATEGDMQVIEFRMKLFPVHGREMSLTSSLAILVSSTSSAATLATSPEPTSAVPQDVARTTATPFPLAQAEPESTTVLASEPIISPLSTTISATTSAAVQPSTTFNTQGVTAAEQQDLSQEKGDATASALRGGVREDKFALSLSPLPTRLLGVLACFLVAGVAFKLRSRCAELRGYRSMPVTGSAPQTVGVSLDDDL
eukprot:TRINITY_DN39849_c0_g1_i1.p1 TRINITY_DN39849_c0_g1~~TRINITY_DN39849_c0_g1_i1.p1  ORF type:complete len:739 (+),score=97.14 TRINITY_DN39849_c0_g1_i1:72-2288(+)